MAVRTAVFPAGARRMLVVTLVPLCLAAWPAWASGSLAGGGTPDAVPVSSIRDALESPLDIPGHVPRRDRIEELEQRERMRLEHRQQREQERDRRVLEERRDFREQRRQIETRERERLERERLRRRDEWEQRDPRQ